MSGLKKSTIQLVLKQKLESWFKSIDNKEVLDAIKADVIVSGGAISCMLAGDKVNDYDVYFRTQATAIKVAQYYVAKFNAAVALKSEGVSKNLQPTVRVIDRKNIKGEVEKRVVVWMQSSGVTSESQETYKYFEQRPESETEEFMSSLHSDSDEDSFGPEFNIPVEEVLETVATAVEPKNKGKYRPVFFSENAVTLSDRMQVVIRFCGEPQKIHENYNYAHCMCYYDYTKGELATPIDALESIMSKALVYKGSLYPIASLFRLRKFIARGWRITAGQMLKIIWQLNGVDLSDPKVLREQLIGVDQAYMHQLLRALENREPGTKIDATYLATLIDQIFE